MRGLLVALVAFFACAAPAFAGGPYMLIGAAEDNARTADPLFAQAEMRQAKLVGFDTIRFTQTWVKGQTTLGPNDRILLGNATVAAQLSGIRVVLSLYPVRLERHADHRSGPRRLRRVLRRRRGHASRSSTTSSSATSRT